MSNYKINGYNMEDHLIIDNTTNGISVTGYKTNSTNGFPNKYQKKFGSSKYSYTKLNYLINGIDQGTLFSPEVTAFTASNSSHTMKNGTKTILCITLGSGGGGTGGNYSSGDGESGGAGGGGGGGGLAWVYYNLNSSTRTISITVGAGGSAGTEGDPTGNPGNDGNPSSVTYNSVVLCTGNGGGNGIRATSNNPGGNGGPPASGSVTTNSNKIEGGTQESAPGADGETDPDEGNQNSNAGQGGAGGNGGTTTYTYGYLDASKAALTIPILKFDSVVFLDDNRVLDPNSTLTEDMINGISGGWGRGGDGGRGEGRNNGSSLNGSAGGQGYVILVEYPF
jgi:hypothetical protein